MTGTASRYDFFKLLFDIRHTARPTDFGGSETVNVSAR
jgi:hypothetical protein